ncbi:MAG: glycoside hydrolase family 2 TIM barrel-domain containing protein [Prolixibacteraceae bacterium]
MELILNLRLKEKSLICFMFFMMSLMLQAQSAKDSKEIIQSFDKDWRFIKQDISGAENPVFDDSGWRRLDVPHDWSIEGPYDKANPTGRGGGYLPAGIGWYRKGFVANEEDSNKKFFIEFDGVMANSDVWINGFHLGKRPYGYSSFSYDLTGHLKFGKGRLNIIAVRADNSVQPASRYYTGAGIYRHVRLVINNQIYIPRWGVYISASEVSSKKATVSIQAEARNESGAPVSAVIETTVKDQTGAIVATTESKVIVPSGQTAKVQQTLKMSDPKLWDTGQPNLYQAVTTIKNGKKNLDQQTNIFGLRDSKFEASSGYWLNGRNIKIKGVCLHDDGGAVGAAVPLGIWERRLQLLKEAGVNAIRTAHNPFAPEFLDLCDRMGFLVMDETFDTWMAVKPNGEKGYNLNFKDWWERDTQDMVLRDRNHPSLILYSVGNEIRDNLNDSTGFKKYRDQQDLIHRLDPGRPVTMALFRPGSSKVYENGFAETMDIVGQNYREKELVDLHQAKQNLRLIGTENGHGLAEWLILRDNPFISGHFLWTGMDYLGEALWPQISFNQGLFDRTGEWKTLGLQRQSWWSDKPVVHLVRKADNAGVGEWVANWSPVDPGTYDDARVQVYSNCEEVELFLNGKSLGVKTKPADDSPRSWEVTFEKGTLKAIGKNKGIEVAKEELKTACDPAKIMLTADRSAISFNWDEVCLVSARVVDANGVICPNADKLISFAISGEGVIAAVDNGDVNSHEAYQSTERRLYDGKCIVLIRAKAAKGKITVTAGTPGLANVATEIEVH